MTHADDQWAWVSEDAGACGWSSDRQQPPQQEREELERARWDTYVWKTHYVDRVILDLERLDQAIAAAPADQLPALERERSGQEHQLALAVKRLKFASLER